MSTRNSGMIFQTDDERKCIAYSKAQRPEFGRKLLVQYVDANFQPVGNPVLKDPKLLKQTGFVD